MPTASQTCELKHTVAAERIALPGCSPRQEPISYGVSQPYLIETRSKLQHDELRIAALQFWMVTRT
ncbi:hypothetical protein AC579_3885 [Pseudocercospora musae]|uniref:Uncharacterized protein n=1 Tax=Pseudocercospora musae TaxID=113226 RepID=A0A139IRZ3_9PEZI|nr:hypothetical protein AC579_3885 [Pseudocercospora musae]